MHRHSWCAGVLALAALGACAPKAPAGPNVVTLTAADFSFGGPDTIPAGLTTIRLVNQGKELHEAILVRLGGGHTVAEFQAGMQDMMTHPGPAPAWVQFAGGPNDDSPGDTSNVTEMLEAGTYVVFCAIPSADGVPHVAKGMIRTLVVTPSTAAAVAEPASDLTMKLVEYGFQLSRPLTAGTTAIRVENAGQQPHEVAVAALLPGKRAKNFVDWELGGEKGPPPTGKWLGGVGALLPGGHASFSLTLASGNYLLLCFFPDAKDGKAHIVHGMTQEISIN
jgi:plastocyanin